MNRMQKRILRNTLLAIVAAIVFGVCGQGCKQASYYMYHGSLTPTSAPFEMYIKTKSFCEEIVADDKLVGTESHCRPVYH